MIRTLFFVAISVLTILVQNAYAQCKDTITHAGKGCVGDTLTLKVKDASHVQWRRGTHTIQSLSGTIASAFGITVAGQQDGTSGGDSTQLNTPYGVYVDNKGNVYVSDYINQRVQKWPANGAGKYGITVAGQADGTLGYDSAHLNYPNLVYVDSAGNVYVADGLNNRVQKWPAIGAGKHGVTVAGQKSSVGGSDSAHLSYPFGVYVDAHGNLYVSDYNNHRVQKWPANGTGKYGITVAGDKNGTYGTDSTHLYFPAGICVDANDNIYIADAGNNRIQKWAKGAKYGVTVAGQKSGVSGVDSVHLDNPKGLAVDADNNIYIADANNNRVQKWTPGAKYGITIAGQANGNSGTDSTSLNIPIGLFVDSSASIYISDANNNRIQKWAAPSIPNGTLILKTDSGGAYTSSVLYKSGCTSVSNSIGIHAPVGTSVKAATCFGTTYTFNGKAYSMAGTYIDTLIRKTGCDSLLILNLSVKALAHYTINDTLKNGVSGTINKKVYKTAGTFADTLYYNSAHCDSVILTIVITTVTGAQNLIASVPQFNISPNPNNGHFTIDLTTYSPAHRAYVEILNIVGQKVYGQTAEDIRNTKHITISTASLPAGMYIVRLVIAGTSYAQKIIIDNR